MGECACTCAYGCKQFSTAACGRRPGSNISPRAGRSAAAPARDKRQQTACRSSANADGLRQRPAPTAYADGLRRRRSPTDYAVGVRRRNTPKEYADALRRRRGLASGVAECHTGAGRPSRLQPGGVAAQQRLEGVCADVRVGAQDHALATRTCRRVCGRDSPHICAGTRPNVSAGTRPTSAPGLAPTSAPGLAPHLRRDSPQRRRRDSPHICAGTRPNVGAGTRPTSAPGLAPHLRRDSTALTDPWVTAGYSRDSGYSGYSQGTHGTAGYSWALRRARRVPGAHPRCSEYSRVGDRRGGTRRAVGRRERRHRCAFPDGGGRQ
jgi:hypothetical protein